MNTGYVILLSEINDDNSNGLEALSVWPTSERAVQELVEMRAHGRRGRRRGSLRV